MSSQCKAEPAKHWVKTINVGLDPAVRDAIEAARAEEAVIWQRKLAEGLDPAVRDAIEAARAEEAVILQRKPTVDSGARGKINSRKTKKKSSGRVKVCYALVLSTR
jgi:hypothetical protein